MKGMSIALYLSDHCLCLNVKIIIEIDKPSLTTIQTGFFVL